MVALVHQGFNPVPIGPGVAAFDAQREMEVRPGALYQESDGSFSIRQKTIAEVVGEKVLSPVIGRIGNAYSKVFGEVKKSCAEDIFDRFPGIGRDVKEIVTIICSNADDILTFNEDYSRSVEELEAIGAALTANTALKSLEIAWDVEEGAQEIDGIAPLIRMLRKNTTLKHLQLASVENYFTTPALRLFAENFVCFHLESLDMWAMHFETTEAHAFQEALMSPHLKIANITLPWWRAYEDGSVGIVAEGVSKSSCLSALDVNDPGNNLHVNIFMEAIKTAQALSHVSVFIDDDEFLTLNQTTMLDSIRDNGCIADFKVAEGIPSEDLLKKIANLTKGRMPCGRPASCEKPLTNCPEPPPASDPSGDNGYPLSPAAWISIGASVVLAVFGIGGGVAWLKRKKSKAEALLG